MITSMQRGKMLSIFNAWLDALDETRGGGTAMVFTMKQDASGSLYLRQDSVDSMPTTYEWVGATIDELYAFYSNDPEGMEIDEDVARHWREI
jgi:hypothetical protein